MAEVRTDPLFDQGFNTLRALVEEAEREAHRGAWKDTVKALSYCKRQVVVIEAQAMLLRDGAVHEEGSQQTLPGTGPASENHTPAEQGEDPGLRFLTSDDYRSMLELLEQADGGMTTSELATQLDIDEGEAYQMAEFAVRRGTFERDGQLYSWLGENALLIIAKPACIEGNEELYDELKQELQQAGTAGLTSDALAEAVSMDPQDCYDFCEWFHNRRGVRKAGSVYIWLCDPDTDPFEDDEDTDEPVGLHAVEPGDDESPEPEPLPEGVSEAMEPAQA